MTKSVHFPLFFKIIFTDEGFSEGKEVIWLPSDESELDGNLTVNVSFKQTRGWTNWFINQRESLIHVLLKLVQTLEGSSCKFFSSCSLVLLLLFCF